MLRHRLTIRGIVQGVGFRPFVFRLATGLGLAGWVRNDAGGVTVEAQGTAAQLAELQRRLLADKPTAARIDAIETQVIPPQDAAGFAILASDAASSSHTAAIGSDLCTCPACLAELFDPQNRRYRYAFSNCTDCGPRYTIARRLPYDRAQTSMAAFPQCPACFAEYTDPANRRFHAEPNACPVCGPRLTLFAGTGEAGREKVEQNDPIAETLARIQRGEIVAIKGLGGFHLVCDARNAAAVAKLRERKQREEKPLAIMVANVASLAGQVEISDAERAELESPARPIVLLRKCAPVGASEAGDLALLSRASLTPAKPPFPGIADDLEWLGVMLPYTPLHYLLFHEAAGRPAGTDWLNEPQALTLVMTSANPHGEPLVTDNAEALATLGGIADAFLLHDRDIVIRADDSVLRMSSQGAQFVRRARGYTPLAIPWADIRENPTFGLNLSKPARPSISSGRTGLGDVLALGGFYKNTLCFTRGDHAFLSQHIGDLDRVANCRALEAAVDHLQGLLQVTPQAVVHDLHPDFFSTQLAQRMAERWQIPAIAVQHHHAHIAAVLAEHGVGEPVLGLALDGVGYGLDGAAWGGELLLVDGAKFERLGHLRPIGLPGGDKAAREPWRMGAAALHLLGRGDEITTRSAAEPGAALVAQMLARGVLQTTSMGRWFDAAAGLLGILPRMSFEGQAAMRLEGLAERRSATINGAPKCGLMRESGKVVLDLLPLLAQLANEADAVSGAARFHAGLTQALADWVADAADSTGIRTVACGGGCFLNAILARGLRQQLEARGIRMLEAQAAPPGDGGLALGQAWVAQRLISPLRGFQSRG